MRLFFVFAVFLFACSSSVVPSPNAAASSGLAPPVAVAPSPPPARLLAFTVEPRLVLTDEAGDVLARSPDLAAGLPFDLAIDARWKRAVTFESDEDEQSGEIVAYSLDGGLGARAAIASVDGLARLLPTAGGIVEFELGYASQWKLLSPVAAPSILAPMPASVSVKDEGDALSIDAFTYGPLDAPTAFERRHLAIDHGALVAKATAIEIPSASDPPTARLVERANGDATLVDAVDSLLFVTTLTAEGAQATRALAMPGWSGRIEAAVETGGVVVLLTSGANELVAFRSDDGALARLALPGAVRVETQFFSRDLAVIGPRRVVVATSDRVFAIDLTDAPSLSLTLDATFDGSALRGPLAVLAGND